MRLRSVQNAIKELNRVSNELLLPGAVKRVRHAFIIMALHIFSERLELFTGLHRPLHWHEFILKPVMNADRRSDIFKEIYR